MRRGRKGRRKIPAVNLLKLVPELERRINPKTGAVVVRPGEPTSLLLERFHDDKSLRSWNFETCCDCGLSHLTSYEVFTDPVGNWWLNTRSFRAMKLDRDSPKPRRKRGKA